MSGYDKALQVALTEVRDAQKVLGYAEKRQAEAQRYLAVAIQKLETATDQGKFVDILFPGASRPWTYELAKNTSTRIVAGMYARVGLGEFAGKVGEIKRVHTTPPNCNYCYPVTEVIS